MSQFSCFRSPGFRVWRRRGRPIQSRRWNIYADGMSFIVGAAGSGLKARETCGPGRGSDNACEMPRVRAAEYRARMRQREQCGSEASGGRRVVPVIHGLPRALALMAPAGDIMPLHPKSQDTDVVPCISRNRIADGCTVWLGTVSLGHMLTPIIARLRYEPPTVQDPAEIFRYARQHPGTPRLHAHQHLDLAVTEQAHSRTQHGYLALSAASLVLPYPTPTSSLRPALRPH